MILTDKLIVYLNVAELMKQCVPVAFLNIIINWYTKLTIMVRWNTAFSDSLRIRSGVRQGGVLSPHLFNVYADMFINNVVSQKTGCYVNRCCVASVSYTHLTLPTKRIV